GNQLLAGHADQLDGKAAHVRLSVALMTAAPVGEARVDGPRLAAHEEHASTRALWRFDDNLSHGADVLFHVQGACHGAALCRARDLDCLQLRAEASKLFVFAGRDRLTESHARAVARRRLAQESDSSRATVEQHFW